MAQQHELKTYSELRKLTTFEERFRYLMLNGTVSQDTFGFDRWMNQVFYRSAQWKRVRNEIILRDNGCDLGVDGYDVFGKILVHHMNPITKNDISFSTDFLLNPEYLITLSMDTHNAIHYGDESYLERFKSSQRKEGDTCPWK